MFPRLVDFRNLGYLGADRTVRCKGNAAGYLFALALVAVFGALAFLKWRDKHDEERRRASRNQYMLL